MQEILEAFEGGASGDDIAALAIPESYRAAHVLRAEQDMWEGVPSADKDPRKSLHIGPVPTPTKIQCLRMYDSTCARTQYDA